MLATAAWRFPYSLTWSLRVEVEAHGGPSSERAAGRARLSGDDPDAMAASLAAYETSGVQHVILALNTGDVATITRLMETIARDVVPRFRSPTLLVDLPVLAPGGSFLQGVR